MKHPSAAYRRHQAERVKARVRRYFVCLDGWEHERRPTDDARRIGMMARTPKPCSCWACGNERHWFGTPTIQEKKAPHFSEWDEPNL